MNKYYVIVMQQNEIKVVSWGLSNFDLYIMQMNKCDTQKLLEHFMMSHKLTSDQIFFLSNYISEANLSLSSKCILSDRRGNDLKALERNG